MLNGLEAGRELLNVGRGGVADVGELSSAVTCDASSWLGVKFNVLRRIRLLTPIPVPLSFLFRESEEDFEERMLVKEADHAAGGTNGVSPRLYYTPSVQQLFFFYSCAGLRPEQGFPLALAD